MRNRISKHHKSSHNLNCNVRRDIGNSERVEGQESVHAVGGPTGYLRSAAVANKICRENQNTLFIFNIFFNHAVYEINWKNILDAAGHRRQYNKAHAHCMLDT